MQSSAYFVRSFLCLVVAFVPGIYAQQPAPGASAAPVPVTGKPLNVVTRKITPFVFEKK